MRLYMVSLERHRQKNPGVFYRSQTWAMAVLLMISSCVVAPPAEDASRIYYVATDGDDSNPGSASEPFGTFDKALTALSPGDQLRIVGGTYQQSLDIESSGTVKLPITISPVEGQEVIIDAEFDSGMPVRLTGSHIVLEGLEVRRSNNICVDISGDHILVRDLKVHDCVSHGIRISGEYVLAENNTVFNTVLENQSRDTSGGWSSGVKVREGEYIILENNTIFENYGEGIAARGRHITIRANNVYDNFSVNIYMGNTFDVLVERNFVTCGPNTGFERDGHPAVGIGMAEEYYPEWGAQLGQIVVRNNIVAYCWQGITYGGAESEIEDEAGLDRVAIIHNTLWGILDRGILIQDEPAKTRGSIIANNIVQSEGAQAVIKPEQGVDTFSNFWVGSPQLVNAAGPGDLSGDVGFASTPGYAPESFRLASSSPAIDAGVDLGVNTDFNDHIRANPDMGAIEFERSDVAP